MRLKKATTETRLEETILMGMIVSTDLLLELRSLIDSNYFTSTYSQTVCNWILDYFDAHQKAPYNMLESIFESKKDLLDREDVSVIAKLFERMNKLYADMENPSADFFRDLSLPFFEKRELELKIEKAQGFLAQGEIEQAKDTIFQPSKVEIVNFCPISPTSTSIIEEAFFQQEDAVLNLPGAVGNLLGPLNKKWMVMIQAPMKRGKTFLSEEIGFLATLDRKRVYYVSMEMSEKDMSKRHAKRITACADEGEGYYIVPTFDCRLNQDGSCESKNRGNEITLVSDDGQYPDYSDVQTLKGLSYKPCTYCRDLGDKRVWDQSVWFKTVWKRDILHKSMMERIANYDKMYGEQYMKFVAYPKFSRSITEIFQDYERFSQKTGWKADIFIIDYLDITKPERFYKQSRDTIDDNWKTAAGLFSKYDVLGITPSQGSRASIKKAIMEEDDTSEDIRKLAHVDICISMNQTRIEKRKHVYRLGLLAHRHRRFDINENALVLCQFQLGQVILDSTTVFIQEQDFEEQNDKKKGRGKNKND